MQLAIEKVLFLKEIDLFANIDEDDLIELAVKTKELHLPAGESIFHKGDTGTELYIIVKGRIKIHIGEKALIVLEPKQHFGELAHLDPQPRSASASALDDCKLLAIERIDMKRVMRNYPNVVDGIISYLVNKVRALTPKLPSSSTDDKTS